MEEIKIGSHVGMAGKEMFLEMNFCRVLVRQIKSDL